MSKPLKPRRGTTAEQNAFVGEAYEVTYDTDKNTLVCRDGLTAGGFPLARADEVAQKNVQQDAAIEEALNRMSLPLGILLPYTGKDVPPGFLRPDGTTYPGFDKSFPDFYAWLLTSGLTKPLAEYTLVEGNCGYYGIDEATGTVRMPTITNGFVGAAVAGQYGQAVRAGAPNITGTAAWPYMGYTSNGVYSGALGYDASQKYSYGATDGANAGSYFALLFNAAASSTVYRDDIDTIQPSHVKYPWVIVVYNAAVPPSVAQAGEFMGLLDGKAGVNAKNFTAEGKALLAGLGMPSVRYVDIAVGASGTAYTPHVSGYFVIAGTTTAAGGLIGITNKAGVRDWAEANIPSQFISACIPALKGDVIEIGYNNVNITKFRVVYASGEVI